MELRRERQQVVEACRELARQGLVVGTGGNVSVRAHEGMVISPSAVPYDELRPEMVGVVDLQGRTLVGALKPSSEWPLHAAVYRATGARAVVHSHASASTAVGLLVDQLPATHYYCALFGGPVRVAPYAPFGSPELARHVVEALRDRAGALMANHGAVTVGQSLPAALSLLPYLEYLCEVHLRALATGLPPRTLSQADIAEVVRRLAGYGQNPAVVDDGDYPVDSP